MGEALLLPQQPIDIELQLPARTPITCRARCCAGAFRGPGGGVAPSGSTGLTPALVESLASILASPAPAAVEAEVLVVWNRPAGRPSLEKELADLNPPPLFATSPLEAAAWLRVDNSQLQAVLVDYLLAGADGWDFLQHLREHHAEHKRVLLVDGVGNFRLNLLLSSGLADAALEKPWTAATLAHKLGLGRRK